jgi:hypothetical protein
MYKTAERKRARRLAQAGQQHRKSPKKSPKKSSLTDRTLATLVAQHQEDHEPSPCEDDPPGQTRKVYRPQGV